MAGMYIVPASHLQRTNEMDSLAHVQSLKCVSECLGRDQIASNMSEGVASRHSDLYRASRNTIKFSHTISAASFFHPVVFLAFDKLL